MKMKINLNILVRNIIILIVFIAVIVVVIFVPKSGNFSPDVTKNRYKSEKSADELKLTYEKDGVKEEFLKDVSNVQNAVSMALLNDEVVNDKKLKERITEINKVLKSEDWSMLDITMPTFWVGTWSIDKSGTVKFTFVNDKCIPDWAHDEDAKVHIVLK